MSIFNKYKSLVSGQAVKDMKLVLDQAKKNDRAVRAATGYKMSREMGDLYQNKQKYVNSNFLKKRKAKKDLLNNFDNMKKYSRMRLDSKNNLNDIANDLSKIKKKQNVARVGTVGALGGAAYGGKKLYDNKQMNNYGGNMYYNQMEVNAFDIVEGGFEKIAINASKARYLAKQVGIISPENTTKAIKKSLKPYLDKGNLKSGRQIQRMKESLGALPNNTFNKLKGVSERNGHLAEIGAEFKNYASKKNLNLKNVPSEGAKALAKQYNDYANLAEKKDIISKAKAKLKGRKLTFADSPKEARNQARELLSPPPNSKYNTRKGSVIIGNKANIMNIGGNGNSTTHTHPGHSKIKHMALSKSSTNSNDRKDYQRLVDGYSKKSENYKLVTPSSQDKRLFSNAPNQKHNIIQPERNIEGVHQTGKNSIYFDRRPKKERMEEVKELKKFFK